MLVATDVLLDTIELDNISEIVDVGELATSVDLARLSDAIRERDPDLAFDLSHLERALDQRELWNSIDLSAFVKAKRTLDRELGDVLGNDTSIELPADSKAVSDAKEFIAALQDEAKQALLQQEATEKLTAVREAVVEGHAEFEWIYASNKGRFARTKARSVGGNPTAVSLLPSGPLPDSVSTLDGPSRSTPREDRCTPPNLRTSVETYKAVGDEGTVGSRPPFHGPELLDQRADASSVPRRASVGVS